MSNMSYRRFQNTTPDLRDCYDNIDEVLANQHDDDLSENDAAELRCCKKLIKLCVEIALNYCDEIDMNVIEASS